MDDHLTTCRDCGKRFRLGPLLDLPQPTRCMECLIGLEARLAAAEKERDEAREALAGFLDEPCKDCLAYEAQMSGMEDAYRDSERARRAAEARVAELEARLDTAESALEEIMAESERWHDEGWTGAHVAFTALGGRTRRALAPKEERHG